METEENAWLVPDLKDGAVFETKVVIKRSIFITTVGRVRGLEGAKKFVADISAKYSDARHNPFAFNGGPAGNSGFAGCSDDGEPHGTAGQPMLQVVLHSGIGEVAAVVTRYFGGIKLGTGGLVRAYQGCVSDTMKELPVKKFIEMKAFRVRLSMAYIGALKRLMGQTGAETLEENYGAEADFLVNVPIKEEKRFAASVVSLSSGSAIVSEVPALQ